MVHRLRSPFLSILHWSFEDQGRMHFVTVRTYVVVHAYYLLTPSQDFYPGGNLLTHLKRSGTFHPDRAHFYACEIVSRISLIPLS
jgi:serum/glucocorticoid-regulated kinase 2